MMTPKEYAEHLYNQYDMIIYTDQNHDEQVKACSIKAVELTLLTLERLICNSWVTDTLEDEIIKEQEYFENVKRELVGF